MVKIVQTKLSLINRFTARIWNTFWRKKGLNSVYVKKFYIIKEKNKKIGYIKIIFDSGVAHVNDIIIIKNMRGKGIGHKIMGFIDKEAIKKKCHKIRLETQKDLLPNAYHLYTKFGFKEEAVLKKDYFKKDWVVLSKYL